MTKGYLMNSLIEKMNSPDQDFRYMGLNDLMNEIKADPSSFVGDEAVENRVIEKVLSLVEDKISEVKNQAVKCLGQLIKIIKQQQMEVVVDRLIEYSGGKEEELRDISGLALKTICAETPADNKIAVGLCAKLTPKILAQIQNSSTPPEALVETLSVLTIIVQRFSSILANSPPSPPPLTVLAPLLSNPRPVVRKRAITTIAHFVPISTGPLFEALLQEQVLANLQAGVSVDKQRTTANLVAAVTRQSPFKIAPALPSILPALLKAVEKDDEELREGVLQALEAVVIRCQAETTPFLTGIIQVGTKYIKWDPNYAGDDEDEEMADPDEDDDDDDEDLDNEYSDDEDTSYKIRRASTKLLSSIIATRPELLSSLYKDVSPVLISRFGDREETVRLEVWATYGVLLRQTAVYGSFSSSSTSASSSGGAGKRKRDSEERELSATSGGISSSLQSQIPSLSKALLSQVKSPKTPPAQLQAAFELLHALLSSLPGSLAQQSSGVLDVAKRVLGSSPSTTTSALHLSILSFLALFFNTHSPSAYGSSLPSITPALLKSAAERHPRVSADAFKVFSALLSSASAQASGDWVQGIYTESVKRLAQHDTDADVRSASEEVIADLWIHATPVVQAQDRREWGYICNPARGEGSVRVVVKVASVLNENEGGVKGVLGEAWLNDVLEWLIGLLKRGGEGRGGGKAEVFGGINVLLKSYGTSIPQGLPSTLIPVLKPYLALSSTSTPDITLLTYALSTLSLLLTLAPSSTYPEIESLSLLSNIYSITISPLVQGSALDALLGFVEALVSADSQVGTHLIMGVVGTYEKKAASASTSGATATATSGEVSAGNAAKAVAAVIRSDSSLAAGVIAQYSKHLKVVKGKVSVAQVVISLLILGELGRFIDLAPQHEVFNAILALFDSEGTDDEVRQAASFAVGNIAIGNGLAGFLKEILALVEHTSSSSPKKLGGLWALKEVVTHADRGKLEHVAEKLWVPLFENAEASFASSTTGEDATKAGTGGSSSGEESTRNVAAACLGKLAATQPSKFLPQLHSKVRDENPSTRATVVSAIRYTFTDDATKSLDDLLAPLIVDFLSLMTDSDLTVRRLALSSLNSAARTKPHLIRDHLPVLLPGLYKETEIKPELIRTVQMGPWTHKVDEGLEGRKTAFETMYTLIDTLLPQIPLSEFLQRVLAGLKDTSDEIKTISHMLLFRLATLAPLPTSQILDDAVEPLEKTMKFEAGKDTVKQDLERAAELKRSAGRAVVALAAIVGLGSGGGGGKGVAPRFESFVEGLRRSGGLEGL